MGKRRPHNAPKVKEVSKEVKRHIVMHTIQAYNNHIKSAMRSNKISEDRALKIITEAINSLASEGE